MIDAGRSLKIILSIITSEGNRNRKQQTNFIKYLKKLANYVINLFFYVIITITYLFICTNHYYENYFKFLINHSH